ncbi:MAG: Fic family protein [Thermonemataceae bacterium]
MESKLLFDFKTNQLIIKKIAYIDSFKGKWIGLQERESVYLEELKQIAIIESIGSSTRIEGSTLTNDEVKQLLNNLKISSLKTRDEQEVFGYYEVLNLILESFDDIEITKNNIHHLHKILLSKSAKDESHRGKYKKLSNKVVANYPEGQ